MEHYQVFVNGVVAFIVLGFFYSLHIIDNLENLSSVEFKRDKLKEFFKKKQNIFYLIGVLIFLGLLIVYL